MNRIGRRISEEVKIGFLDRHDRLAVEAFDDDIKESAEEIAVLARKELKYSKTTVNIDILRALRFANERRMSR